MAQPGTTKQGSKQAPDKVGKDAIRPFQVNVPEAELTELRRRINDTKWPERETVADARKACSSRRLKRSRAIGRRNTTGASARQN